MKAKTKSELEPKLSIAKPFPSMEDFVFLDDSKRPFRVREMMGDGFWILYLHPDKKWVTLRRTDLHEAGILFLSRSLNAEQTRMYEMGNPFLNDPEKPDLTTR